MLSQPLAGLGRLPTLLVPVLGAASVILAAAGAKRNRERPTPLPVEVRSRKSPTPAGAVEILERVGRSRLGQRIGVSASLRRRAELARSPLSPDGIKGLKLALAGGSAACFVVLAPLGPAILALGVFVTAAALGVPDLVLARQAARRQERIGAGVTDLVEILVATSEAGLSPPQAFRRACVLVRGPLGEELGTAVRHLDLGLPWRAALEQLARANDVPALGRLVAALARSHRLGTPVRSVLRSVAADLRMERRTRAEETARRAPVKMLFPMVFLILPAFLLLTVGPVVLATIRALH
jgi:tight adherence protein C